MLSSACKNTATAYYRFLDVGLIIMNLEARFFAAAFFSAAKKYLPPCTLSPSVTRVVFYYNKNQGEFIFGPVFLVRKKLLPD